MRSISAPGRVSDIIAEIFGVNIDILCLTETWLRSSDELPARELTIASFKSFFSLVLTIVLEVVLVLFIVIPSRQS